MSIQRATTKTRAAYPAKSASAVPVGAPRGRRRPPPPSTPCFRRSLDLLRALSPSSTEISFYPSHLQSTQSLTHLIHAANASLTVNSHRDALSDGCGYLSMWILSSSLLPPCWHQINAGSAACGGGARSPLRAMPPSLPPFGRTGDGSPAAGGGRRPRPRERERSSVRPPHRRARA